MKTLHTIFWIVVVSGAAHTAVTDVGRLPNGTALSSYGSRPQAVAPVPASIAIAEAR